MTIGATWTEIFIFCVLENCLRWCGLECGWETSKRCAVGLIWCLRVGFGSFRSHKVLIPSTLSDKSARFQSREFINLTLSRVCYQSNSSVLFTQAFVVVLGWWWVVGVFRSVRGRCSDGRAEYFAMSKFQLRKPQNPITKLSKKLVQVDPMVLSTQILPKLMYPDLSYQGEYSARHGEETVALYKTWHIVADPVRGMMILGPTSFPNSYLLRKSGVSARRRRKFYLFLVSETNFLSFSRKK